LFWFSDHHFDENAPFGLMQSGSTAVRHGRMFHQACLTSAFCSGDVQHVYGRPALTQVICRAESATASAADAPTWVSLRVRAFLSMQSC
jgi:hypothetical protein